MTHLRIVSLLLVATCLPAQTVREGYETTLTALPTTAGQPLVLGTSIVYFTGTDLVLSGSGSTRKLLSFTQTVFGSFVIQVAPDTLLFGESSNGSIWLVPTSSTGRPKLLNTVKFNYSATLYDSEWAILSAKTGGLSAKDNDVIAINLSTGTTDTIAVLPGASGPVVCDPYGNLFYATASASFPPPKGSTEILRFSASQVAGAFGTSKLGKADAATIIKGLDAAGAMVLDDDQDLLVTDWANSTVVEISEIHTAFPKSSILASYARANVTAAGLQFVSGSRTGLGLQEFEAFQPSDGGTLWIHESAFNSVSQLRQVTAKRPQTVVNPANPVPAATAFQLQITGGPVGGSGVIALSLGAHRREVAVSLSHEQTIFWADSLLAPIYLAPVSFDSSGSAQIPLFNPGFGNPLILTTQCFLVDQAGITAGSSHPLGLILR